MYVQPETYSQMAVIKKKVENKKDQNAPLVPAWSWDKVGIEVKWKLIEKYMLACKWNGKVQVTTFL